MSSVERVEPTWLQLPGWDLTLGPEVARVCELLGFLPDENQRLILDAVFAERDGRLAASRATVVAARQNLKTAVMEMIAIGWLLVTTPGDALWTAQRYKTAYESFEHICGLLDARPWARRRVARVNRTTGSESIEMHSGMKLWFGARSKDQGRGLKAARLVYDEAYAVQASHLGALQPLLSTAQDPQTIIGSSACRPESYELRRWRDLGRAKLGERAFYAEWADDPSVGAPCELGPECTHLVGTPGCRLDDPERIRHANPSVGVRIPWDNIWEERNGGLSAAEFARERLGWHDEPSADEAEGIPADAWAEAEDPFSMTFDYVFGLSVSPSRNFAAIAVAGRTRDQRLHLEVTSRDELVDYRPGVSWVLPRLRELGAAHSGARLAIVRGSAAESLAPAIERIPGLVLEIVPASAWAPACGFVADQADGRRLAHLGQLELSAAVEASVRRQAGDRAFVWGRRKSGGDITPLAAATAAAWLMAPSDQAYDPLAGAY